MHTNATALLNPVNSPVLFEYEGAPITLVWLFWTVLIIVGWLALVVLGFTIDPYLGELIFRIGIWLIIVWFDKDADIDTSSDSGSGSGRSGRGG
jgi:hypothetical protein